MSQDHNTERTARFQLLFQDGNIIKTVRSGLLFENRSALETPCFHVHQSLPGTDCNPARFDDEKRSQVRENCQF